MTLQARIAQRASGRHIGHPTIIVQTSHVADRGRQMISHRDEGRHTIALRQRQRALLLAKLNLSSGVRSDGEIQLVGQPNSETAGRSRGTRLQHKTTKDCSTGN